MTFSLYCRFCDAHETRLGSDQTPDPSYTCERCTHAYEAGRELAERRAASWKLVAKRYRTDARERRSACELALRLCEALAEERQARELAERRAARWKALAKRTRGERAEWQEAFEFAARLCGRLRVAAYRAECAAAARVFCHPAASARVSSAASGFPGRRAPACKETRNMSENNGIVGVSAGGAEGGTLNTGEPTQPNQAAPGRFPKTACHKLANGVSASAGAEDGRGGSSVQCERNGTGVQRAGFHRNGWPADKCGNPACEGSKLCEAEGCPAMHPNGCSADRSLDGWRCPGHATGRYPSSRPPVALGHLDGSNTNDDLNADACEGLAEERRRADHDGGKLVSFAQALDAARGWARDWLDVYGQPCALWELLLRFAALVAMRPGEKRRLDEAHTVRLFEAEPGALLEVGQLTAGIVLPFGTERFGRALPEGEVGELEALVRGAIQRVEALQAEAELFRHAAGLIRGDGFSDHWTAGADFRDMAGVPLDGPHPDAYRFSLVGAMRQAWAERGGAGQLPLASLKRLVTLAAPACFTFRVEPPTVESLQDVLRIVNDQRERERTAKSVLELLTRAALAADAEAESEVL